MPSSDTTAAAASPRHKILKQGLSSGSDNNTNNDDALFLPPGRMGVVRGCSTPTRSRSPSVTRTTLDGSISSIEDYDSDILTDRAGISDDLSESQRKLLLANNLHPVMERMTEDSLEDVHAFSDVTTSARASVCSSNYPGDALLLEPLAEGEEEEEVAVTITNLENLDLGILEEEAAEDSSHCAVAVCAMEKEDDAL